MEIKGVKWTYDRSEVIADGIVHGVGVVFALIGVTLTQRLWATDLSLKPPVTYDLVKRVVAEAAESQDALRSSFTVGLQMYLPFANDR